MEKALNLEKIFYRLNRPLKMLKVPKWLTDRRLDFIVCGVQKAGTTALDSYLRKHSQLFMAEKKEIHFFDNKMMSKWGDRLSYLYLHSFFNGSNSSQLLGEATPIYFWWNGAVERIFKYNSKIKLIVVFREPIQRAFSHWNMEFQRGNETRSFSDAIRSDVCKKQDRIRSYVDRGFYARQLKNLYSYFPKRQVLCLKQEDLMCSPETELNRIAKFLGIDKFEGCRKMTVHSREYEFSLLADDVQYLKSVYKDDIKNLEAMLDWDLSTWLSRPNNQDE